MRQDTSESCFQRSSLDSRGLVLDMGLFIFRCLDFKEWLFGRWHTKKCGIKLKVMITRKSKMLLLCRDKQNVKNKGEHHKILCPF